jgi:bifunctional non-homologous end joining protein LigD
MPLDDYRRKRDFRRTPEPAGEAAPGAGRSFCVQRHAARRLHYDFRLELDGVLKSWAVPKAPSLDPAEKRLAVHVEDHPLAYGSFEGTIPAGEYGAGEVILWDRGHWEPVGDPDEGYRRGKLKFALHGDKLRGGWTLARMGGRSGEGGKNWLLLKERDVEAREATAGDIVAERPESVAAITRGPLPERLRPQLAVLADAPPPGDDWLHEIKYDGYRALCRIEDGRARLFVRADRTGPTASGPVAGACAALRSSPHGSTARSWSSTATAGRASRPCKRRSAARAATGCATWCSTSSIWMAPICGPLRSSSASSASPRSCGAPTVTRCDTATTSWAAARRSSGRPATTSWRGSCPSGETRRTAKAGTPTGGRRVAGRAESSSSAGSPTRPARARGWAPPAPARTGWAAGLRRSGRLRSLRCDAA